MDLIRLSPHAEQLLQDIIELYKEHPNGDDSYWEERLRSLSFAQKEEFWSLMVELKDSGYIFFQTADNIPYILSLTSKGKHYFEYLSELEEEKKCRKRLEMRENFLRDLLVAIVGAIVGWLLGKYG